MKVETAEGDSLFGPCALHQLQAHHDHPCVPEKQNIVAADQQAGGVIRAQVFGVVGPAEGGKRPERGAEPGVQDVFVLSELRVAALRAFCRWAGSAGVAFDDLDARVERGNHFFALGTMPDGNAMAPPKLARDAPVANIFEPLQQNGALVVRNNFDQAVDDNLCGGLGERLHFHEPLRGNARFDDGFAAVTGADGMSVLGNFFKQV